MDWQYIREKWKPIAEGLFGKQKSPRYERPHYALRPVEYILERLVNIPELDWRHYAFSREPLNGKFTHSQRLDWMRKSLECGRDYARRMASEFGSDDPEVIARKLGLKVSYPQYPEKTDRVLFAEFVMPDRVNIFMDAVRRAEKLLQRHAVRRLLGEKLNLSKVILSHEIFHHVEDKYSSEIFTRTEKVRLWSLGPLHNDSGIFALGEIAAMSFAKELNHLPYSPYILDVFLMYDYSAEEAGGLYEEIMELSGLKP